MRKLANKSNSYEISLQITNYCSCSAMCPLIYDDPLVSQAHHYRIQRDKRSKL